ncbi:MAG TPA: family 78 glycoside hydrolase catalytic domain [Candidatus Sulfotelmatobacter sp.]|jgi:alpha-L-rhamnosidase|nr:family 78 glycoside hydrolase catalytic domain [Candidatus Sulfotelmatobacter sp.]
MQSHNYGFVKCGLFGVLACGLLPASLSAQSKPVHLECESLTTPLGMDANKPVLSWKLQDATPGARQTAYEIQVAFSAEVLASGKPDVWDSGKVESGDSIGATYAGPVLVASKRYFWRVQVWGKDGQAYPASDVSWWETGLQRQENWKSKWIGYEESELRYVRESGAEWITNSDTGAPAESETAMHDFRYGFNIAKAVRHATLYVAGQDSAGAWINGKSILQSEPLPPWKQMPWKTYSVRDISKAIQPGRNLLAVKIVHYSNGRSALSSQAPMSAVIYLEAEDGSVQVFKSGPDGWRGALNATGDWQSSSFDDTAWKPAIRYVPPVSGFETAELGNPWPTGAVKSLRRGFEIRNPVASARIYATALGAYKLWINGQSVGDQILAPGWTDYRERVIYQTYDVTSDVKAGKNAIAALLAPGWYTTPLQWYRQGYNYGKTSPALRAQLRIEYKDGSVDTILTDEQWKAEISPILSAEIYDGETYDARKTQANWNMSGFDDKQWKPVNVVQPVEPKIVWQYFQPIRVETTLEAKKMKSPAPGVYIFDFGQNLSGVPRISVEGIAGMDVTLRFAEILNPDGSLYVDNLRTAKATDHFVLAGRGREEYQPTFTFHGFRYVEISGLKNRAQLKDLKAVVFHTDAPFTATLRTGSAMLNQLWSNILWGQRSNFIGVPTDCPQRDERLGWSADAQVFWRTATYNMDLTAFSRKFGADLRGTQVGTAMYGIFAPGTSSANPGYGTGWSDAGVVIPWTSWIQTGDKQVIEENWAGMEKYLAAIQAANPNYLWQKNYGIPFADWLAPEGVTPVDLIATAYWAYDVTLMREMAHATGRTSDEQKYAKLFDEIKAAFNRVYVRTDGFVGGVPPRPVFASGMERTLSDRPVETQTGYVLALHMNLLPDSLRSLAANRLVDRIEANHWRLGTGFLGTPYLLSVLSDTGHSDVAYRLLLNTEYPSWGYLVEHGATTMWERWNGDQMRNDPSMNSYNHYAYGAVADWIYRYAAGIDTVPTEPGFHVIRLHPNFDKRLGSLDFSYESPYGTIHSAWTISDGKVIWNLTIPANATGHLPADVGQLQSVKLDGQQLPRSQRVHAISGGVSGAEYELSAGTYQFEIAVP